MASSRTLSLPPGGGVAEAEPQAKADAEGGIRDAAKLRLPELRRLFQVSARWPEIKKGREPRRAGQLPQTLLAGLQNA